MAYPLTLACCDQGGQERRREEDRKYFCVYFSIYACMSLACLAVLFPCFQVPVLFCECVHHLDCVTVRAVLVDIVSFIIRVCDSD